MENQIGAPGSTPADSKGISRRTVVGAAAWSAPILALAAATPMAAASVVDGLSIRFLKPWYRTTPDTSYVDVAAVVENRVGGVATPVEGAQITFTVSYVRPGTVTPPSEPAGGNAGTDSAEGAASTASASIAAAAEMTNGIYPTATLPNGSTTGAFGPTNAEGTYLISPITTGPGWGLLQIDARTTVNGQTATDTTYLEVAIISPVQSAGYPTNGILGNGSLGMQATPLYINYPDFDVAEISGRVHYGSTLRTTDGRIFSWGQGSWGMNGQGGSNATTYWTPMPVVEATDGQTSFTKLARGGRYAQGAIGSNGAAYAWGSNAYGVISGTRGGYVYTPKPIHASLMSDIVQLELGEWTGYALKSDGTVWTWGYNYRGSIGRDDSRPGAYVPDPVQVEFPDNVKIIDIATGWAAGYAVDEHGGLWSWGSPEGYRLGLGDLTQRTSPVRVGAEGDSYAKVFSNSFTYGAAALRADGTATYWGWNAHGQAGNGSTSAANTPVAMGLEGIVQLELTMYSTYARLSNGDVYYTGWNGWGQGGLGNQSASSSFRKVINLDGPATDITSTYGAGFFLTDAN